MSAPSYHLEMLRAADAAEESVEQAYNAMETARIRFQIEALKYAALRDEALAYFSEPDENPYLSALDTRLWGSARANRGRFRFFNMPPAEAVYLALQESDEPQSVQDIQLRIRNGSDRFPDARAVNAALQGMVNGGTVTRIDLSGEDGQGALYTIPRIEGPEIDPDDLPF